MTAIPPADMVRAARFSPSNRPIRDVSTPPLAAMAHMDVERDSSSCARARA